MMKVTLCIFAKYGTNEKILWPIWDHERPTALSTLNATYGGSWLLVDNLKPGEAIYYDDNSKYEGFSPKILRYSDAIIEPPTGK